MRLKVVGWISALCVLLTLQGCGPSVSYVYSPPPDVAGKYCISSCSSQKSQCKTMAQMQSQSQRAVHDAQLTAYNYCRQNGDKKQRKLCSYPSPSYHYGGFGDTCGEDYQACYQNCGGTIRRVVHEN